MGDLTEEMAAAMEALIDQGMSVADALRHVRDSARSIADVFSAYAALSDDAFMHSAAAAPPIPAPQKDWWDSLLEPEVGQLPAIGEEEEEEDEEDGFNPFLAAAAKPAPAPPVAVKAASSGSAPASSSQQQQQQQQQQPLEAFPPPPPPSDASPAVLRQFAFRDSLRRSITKVRRHGSIRASSRRLGSTAASTAQAPATPLPIPSSATSAALAKATGEESMARLKSEFGADHAELISEATREAAAVADVLGTFTAIEDDLASAAGGPDDWWGDLDTLKEEGGDGDGEGDDPAASSNPFLAFQRSFRKSIRSSLRQTRTQSMQRRSVRHAPSHPQPPPQPAMSAAEAQEKEKANNLALRAGLLALEDAESELLAMQQPALASEPQHTEGSETGLIRQRSKAMSVGAIRNNRKSTADVALSSSPISSPTSSPSAPTLGATTARLSVSDARVDDTAPPVKRMGSREEATLLRSALQRVDQEPRGAGNAETAIDLDMYRNLDEKPLSELVATGDLSEDSALTAARWVDKELRKLIKAIQDFGLRSSATGNVEANFGVLYEKTSNLFDAASLDGILSTARSQGIVTYTGIRLRPIVDDLAIITLINPHINDSTSSTYTFSQLKRVSFRGSKSKRSSVKGSVRAAAGGKPSNADEDEVATEDQPLVAAVAKGVLKKDSAVSTARWMDMELRKLIRVIKAHGSKGVRGLWEASFGTLHTKAAREFDAQEVGGLLLTARTQGIVAFVGETLVFPRDQSTVIVLLRDQVADSDETTYTFRQVRQCSINRRKASKAHN